MFYTETMARTTEPKAPAKKLAPFFAGVPGEKVYAEDIGSITFYEIRDVKGKERKSIFKMDTLDDPEWEADPSVFGDKEMQAVFPEGEYEIECRDHEGKFITRRRVLIGDPENARPDPNDVVDERPDPARVQVVDNDAGKIIIPEGMKPAEAAAFVTAQQNSLAAQKRADEERAATLEERKAMHANQRAPADPIDGIIRLQQHLTALAPQQKASVAPDEVLALYKKTNDEQSATIREMRIASESALATARADREKAEAILRETHARELDTLRTTHREDIQTRNMNDLATREAHARALAKADDEARERRAEAAEAHKTALKSWEDKYNAEHAKVLELEAKWLSATRKGDHDALDLNRKLLEVDSARAVAEAEAKRKSTSGTDGNLAVAEKLGTTALTLIDKIKELGQKTGASPEAIDKLVKEGIAAHMKALAQNGAASG